MSSLSNKRKAKKSYKQNSNNKQNLKKYIYICLLCFCFFDFLVFFLFNNYRYIVRQFRLHRPHENVVRPFHSLESSEERSYVTGSLKIPIWGLIDRSQAIKAAEGRGGALSPAYMARFLILLLFAFALFLVLDLIFKCSVTVRVEELVLRYVTLC